MGTQEAHTPGPWKFRRVHTISDRPATALLLETTAPNQPFNDPCILAVREDWIGWLLGMPRGIANANLIAAAPELLEACQRALRAAGIVQANLNLPDEEGGELEAASSALRAAIAKAGGGT